MSRKLARIVCIDGITPIDKADALETAHIGGWSVVVKKNEFEAGDKAVYCEIDSFLPAGNLAWQFLVDKAPQEFEGRIGHVLRSLRLRGQMSQGLLLPLSVLDGTEFEGSREPGTDVSVALGIIKYEKPLPLELQGKARGYFPGRIPKTDEERIQNVSAKLQEFLKEQGTLTVEVSEKAEGSSCTFAMLDGELHVCSRVVDYLEDAANPMWKVARRLDIEKKLKSRYGNIALQGELVGPGVEGNHYELKEHQFLLFRVYLPDSGHWLDAKERHELARSLGVTHVPIIEEALTITPLTSVDSLLAMADGRSAINPNKRREGVVFKSTNPPFSFKAISNAYLMKVKLN